MVLQTRWSERTFDFNFPPGIFPCLLERLRGVPARLDEMISQLPNNLLLHRHAGHWSLQEHAGHFLDTEELWQQRLDDYLAGRPSLTEADLTHRKTNSANYNAKAIADILHQFRSERCKLVSRLEILNAQEITKTSIHPRLKRPIRLVDSVFFACEHDDHYMAEMRRILFELNS